MIKMVISPGYFGINESEKIIKKQINNWGATGVIVDKLTGFVSATITEEKYKLFMDKLREQVLNTINNILSDKAKFPSIIDIKGTEDLYKFTVICKEDTCNEMIDVGTELYLVSYAYQILSGNYQTKAAFCVIFISEASGEVFDIVNAFSIFKD